MRAFLVRRSTVLVLLLLLAGSVLVDAVAPRAFGPIRIYSTWWFVALSTIFLASLGLSTYAQYRRARAGFGRRVTPSAGGGKVVAPGGLVVGLGRLGYLPVAGGPAISRYVKGRWGYWGSFLLHLGMTTAVAGSFVYVLTESRIIVRTVEGERVLLKDAIIGRRQGLLARMVALPEAVTLVRLAPDFWPNDQLRSLASTLSLVEAGTGRSTRVEIAAGQKGAHRGVLVYQQGAFGRVFAVELAAGGRRLVKLLPLPMPPGRAKAGYGSVAIEGSPHTLKAKYYASVDRSGLLAGPPLLVLRLMRGDDVLQQAELTRGARVQLGPYTARIQVDRWWADILLEGSCGTYGIFAGFFLLVCGGLLAYVVVPREVLVREGAGGPVLSWRASRFPGLFREEQAAVMSLAERGGAS